MASLVLLLPLAVDDGYLTGITFDDPLRAGSAMKKVMMPDKGKLGAVCLDGSDAGFYYSPASDASKNASWQLYFEGGGWCYDKKDCLQRSTGDLGSSKKWPDTASAGGIMSDNCKVNPDFCNFHRVYMKYCDGDSFSGNRDDAVVVEGKPLYFRGHRILKGILDTLVASYGLKDAKEVMLTGCSAGGLSTFLHADYVHDYVKGVAPALHKFKAAPISGFFLDHLTVAGKPVYETEMKTIFEMSNATNGVNAACIASYRPEDQWQCNFAAGAFAHTRARTFPLNSALDSWQVRSPAVCHLPSPPFHPLRSSPRHSRRVWQTGCIFTSVLPDGYPDQARCHLPPRLPCPSLERSALVLTLDRLPRAGRHVQRDLRRGAAVDARLPGRSRGVHGRGHRAAQRFHGRL